MLHPPQPLVLADGLSDNREELRDLAVGVAVGDADAA